VYAATSMSIYTNPTSSGDAGTACAPLCTASFYLASIPSAYAGHTLVIDLFDPGDGRAGANGYHMQFLAPPASPPATFANVPVPGTPTSCNYTDAVPTIPASSWPNFDSTCNIETQVPGGSAGGIYNGQWLEVRIALSPTYTCDTDCWWSVQYHFDSGSTPTDRTTWTVSLLGDPVHLTS